MHRRNGTNEGLEVYLLFCLYPGKARLLGFTDEQLAAGGRGFRERTELACSNSGLVLTQPLCGTLEYLTAVYTPVTSPVTCHWL